MSWAALHAEVLDGKIGRQAAIITQAGFAECASSPGFTITPDDGQQIVDFVKQGASPITLQGISYTYYGQEDEKVRLYMRKKDVHADSTVGAGRPKEFVVLSLTTTLILVVKIGPEDNQMDAKFTAEKMYEHLTKHGM